MAIYDVDIFEPIGAVVTSDTTAYSADNTIWPTADGGILEGASDALDALVNAGFVFAELVEPIATPVTADSTWPTADHAGWVTADGGVLEGARDQVDAEVISVSAAVGGGYYPPLRPFPVEGEGYGVLPQLEGEAFGVVVVAGDGRAALPRLAGTATGDVGAAGRSAAQLLVCAAASGDRGQVGAAIGILEGLSFAADGVIAARGSASGMIARLEGIAVGRHDDDEAAAMVFLLAA